jgi:flagellin
MAISFNSSLSSPQTLSSSSQTDKLYDQLSSGNRITSAADDAAGSAIAERITSQLSGFDAAIRNASDSISAIQVADGALSSINDNIGRIQELTIQAGNGILSDQDRQALQEEANLLIEESNRLLENTSFNGKPLLNSDQDLNVQLGASGENLSLEGRNVAQSIRETGFEQIDLNSQDSINASLKSLSQASELIVSRQSELGALSNRIESSVDNIETSKINAAEARSRISDTDYAQAVSDLAASQIRDQIQIAVQGQANSQRSSVLQLLS